MAEAKTDCFAYNKHSINKQGKCTILTECICENRKCSFYKTREQFREDAKRAENKNLAKFSTKGR